MSREPGKGSQNGLWVGSVPSACMWALHTQPVAGDVTPAHRGGWHASGEAEAVFMPARLHWMASCTTPPTEGLETVADSRTPGQTLAAAAHFIADAEGAE